MFSSAFLEWGSDWRSSDPLDNDESGDLNFLKDLGDNNGDGAA